MAAGELKDVFIPHLRGQFERGLPMLFTGAGFSVGAKNVHGDKIPNVEELRRHLWTLCFPGSAFETASSLQDLCDHALLRHPKDFANLLTELFTVDAGSLPTWYQRIFSLPWFRCYTLNIDDLAVASDRRFPLPRKLQVISATASQTTGASTNETEAALQVVYLNGTLADLPDHVTFSTTQYAERLARGEPWYVRLAADLLSHSFVFIGTRLDEPPLWQHIELRKARGGRGFRELRHRSYLVTPTLSRPRQALLAEFNVHWLPMTGEEFVEKVADELHPAAQTGVSLFLTKQADAKTDKALSEVADLARNPMQSSEFLLGEEPIWADLQSGRAITRDSDEDLWRGIADRLQEADSRGLIIVTGTAGSGKSTGLMRACLRLVAEGTRVGWIDRNSELSPRDIRAAMRGENPPPVIAIDDADVFGTELTTLTREIVLDASSPLVLVAVRSGRVDQVLNPVILKDIPKVEFSMPGLADSDIDALIEVLDRENRLGILKGKNHEEQRRLFREHSHRQLLVAMIQATSGRRFEDKVVEELTDLGNDGGSVYGLIAVASAFRIGLTKEDILVAIGDQSNTALNVINQLITRHIIIVRDDSLLYARHRVIAEIIRDKLQQSGQIGAVLSGLALVAATRVGPTLPRNAKPWRLLRSVINHDFLMHSVSLEVARNLFGSLEQLLSWDFHYWLQRRSLEVELGDLKLAENFLNQARGLAPDDPFVENEWAYLLFRLALENPAASTAVSAVEQATATLEDLIIRTSRVSAYPYHVLGSQGLAWSRRGIKGSQQKERYLRKLIQRLKEGSEKYPRDSELSKLLQDLNKEYLGLAVSPK